VATPGNSDTEAGKNTAAVDDAPSNAVAEITTAAAPPDDSPPIDPVFVDVAEEAGINAVLFCGGVDKDHILESTGSGAGMIDYDGDGLLDIYLVNGWQLEENPSAVKTRGKNVLYHNLGGGRFEDVTDKAGVGDEGWGCGVCAGDFDNDGFVDLYVTNFGPNKLYRNRGDGTFEEVAERAGVADPGWGAGSAFFDADGDGDLDLYVANYIDCTLDEVLAAERTNTWRGKVKTMPGPFGMRGGRDKFFRNNGDGTFADATDEAGMTDIAESYGLGVLASDLDNDGDVDVFVTNDSNPNFLYRNDGNGKFTEMGSWSGAGLSGAGGAQAFMGIDAGDLDGDGLQDIFITTFAQDTSTLFRNRGKLLFDDITTTQNLRAYTYDQLSWGCGFFDMDQDGDLDLMSVNGHIYPQVDEDPSLAESYAQQQTLLRMDGGKYTDVSNSAGPGLKLRVSGRGLAFGDYDDDGDLDMLITAIDSRPLLLRNDTPAVGNWLKVRLLNTKGAPAINARALLTVGGVTQLRELRSGSTYESQNAFDLHFGTGRHEQIDRLEIIWPDGKRTEQTGIKPKQLLTIRQPST